MGDKAKDVAESIAGAFGNVDLGRKVALFSPVVLYGDHEVPFPGDDDSPRHFDIYYSFRKITRPEDGVPRLEEGERGYGVTMSYYKWLDHSGEIVFGIEPKALGSNLPSDCCHARDISRDNLIERLEGEVANCRDEQVTELIEKGYTIIERTAPRGMRGS